MHKSQRGGWEQKPRHAYGSIPFRLNHDGLNLWVRMHDTSKPSLSERALFNQKLEQNNRCLHTRSKLTESTHTSGERWALSFSDWRLDGEEVARPSSSAFSAKPSMYSNCNTSKLSSFPSHLPRLVSPSPAHTLPARGVMKHIFSKSRIVSGFRSTDLEAFVWE